MGLDNAVYCRSHGAIFCGGLLFQEFAFTVGDKSHDAMRSREFTRGFGPAPFGSVFCRWFFHFLNRTPKTITGKFWNVPIFFK